MSGSKKPCPGCNKVQDYGRPANQVCFDCQKDLKYAGIVRKKLEEKLKDPEYDVYLIPMYSDIPRYYFRTITFSHDSWNKELGTVFQFLIQMIIAEHGEFLPPGGLEKNVTYNIYPGIKNLEDVNDRDAKCLLGAAYHKSHDLVVLRSDIADAVERLHKEIQIAIKHTAHEAGESGANILVQLAAGDITLDDLENTMNKFREDKR